jgi:predicted dehydrogenase
VKKKILIIGSGSSSKLHKHSLKKISKKLKIIIVPTRIFDKFNALDFNKLRKINLDYIIICSPSNRHFYHVKIIEKYFNKKKVLIEKPIFNKKKKINFKLKNKYFVGYNLRFHPVLIFIKKFLKNKKYFSVKVNCSSYLPNWRNKNYTKTVSANKVLGGGVLLELSHEIDYLLWIFKKIKIINVYSKKISNLTINTDDILNLTAIISKKTFLNLNINFFSQINKRELIVDGNNFSLYGDILNNKIVLAQGKKIKRIYYKNFSNSDTYKIENLNILKNNFTNLCSVEEAIKSLDLIDKIKKKGI